MPYITVESGLLSDEQKEQLIRRLTEVSSEIMKVPQEFFVTTIKEVSDKNFGIGGKTIDKVKEEYIREHQWYILCVMGEIKYYEWSNKGNERIYKILDKIFSKSRGNLAWVL